MSNISLERVISKLGVASRTQAHAWITAGEVTVDGRVCIDPLLPVDSSTVRLTPRGVALKPAARRILMVYKPRGVVCTRSDEKGKKTIFDLWPEEFAGLHSVGRLDMATSGLLLLTNDTLLSSFLTDPANGIPRVYVVTVRGRVDEACVERMLDGVGKTFRKPLTSAFSVSILIEIGRSLSASSSERIPFQRRLIDSNGVHMCGDLHYLT